MGQDYMRRPFKAADWMEPIVMVNDYVTIITQGNTYYRQVNFIESIPPFQWFDFAAAVPNGPLAAATPLAAASTSPKWNITNLDLFNMEFGQWRFFPLDNFQVQLFVPSGVAKWQMKNIQISIDQNIVYRDPMLVSTEFFSYEDNRPAMQAVNFSAYAIPAARIVGWGYRFVTIDPPADIAASIQKGNTPSTIIRCTGLVGQSGARN